MTFLSVYLYPYYLIYAYQTYEYIWKLAYVVCILVTGEVEWGYMNKRQRRHYT